MKNLLKKTLSVILAITIIFSSAYVGLSEVDFSEIKFNGIDLSGVSKFLMTITPDFSVESQAASSGTCGDNLTWILDDEGILTISGTGDMYTYKYSSTVPWYSYRTHIKMVVVESGVTSIGSYAFYDCDNLTSITIPDSVTSIGSYAFDGCYSLTNLYITDIVAWFKIEFGYGYARPTEYAENIYINGKLAENIVIPEEVTEIPYSAFSGWDNIGSVTIPDSVTSIGSSAFEDCTKLTSITIPDSVTSIGYGAFDGCYSLTSITVDSANEYYSSIDGVLFNKVQTALIRYPAGKTNTTYTIPNSLTSIGDEAFSYCTSLTSITIPDSVTSIGYGAFSGCTKLTRITIPDSVTSIDQFAFVGTGYYNNSSNWKKGVLYIGNHLISGENLLQREYIIKEGTKTIASNAFDYCSSLTSITIPDSVTSIGEYAFCYCTSLTSITIPDSVTSIGYEAFYGCDSLASVTIGKGVTSIGGYAFEDCVSLASVTIGDSVTSIGGYAFANCTSLEKVYWNAKSAATLLNSTIFDNAGTLGSGIEFVFGDNVEKIPAYLCCVDSPSHRPEVRSVTIGKGVTSIGDEAFSYCTSLTSITIPDGVTSIGDKAFYNTGYYNNSSNWENGVLYIGNHLIDAKTTLSGEYIIKEGTKTIASNAFDHCSSLTSITIPDSVTSIGDYAFYCCYDLENLYITDIGAWFNVEFGDYYANPKNYAENVYINGELAENIVIPEGVTEIPDSAFYNWDNLVSVTIPDSVTSIGSYAFGYCDSLTSITIPDSVTSIGSSAFYSCDSLTSITIPDSVTSIGDEAFSYCTSLTSITIPDGVTSIGGDAFCMCESLTSITIPDSVTSIGSSAFSYCDSLTSITIPDSVTSIGSSAFYDCDNLTSIIIPDSVTSIGSSAFYSCSNLTSVTIGKGVTSIGEEVFYWCNSLTSITIPDSVTSIGDCAFKSCTRLKFVFYGGSQEDWKTVIIGSDNACFETAIIHFSSTGHNMVDNICIICGCCDFSYSVYDNYLEITGYNGVDKDVVIPEAIGGLPVKYISNYSFKDCDSLTSITIPDSVTSIGEYAFSYCDSLTSVTFGNGLTNIESYAFAACSTLASITIPDSVTSIGNSAFGGCTNITSITLGTGVKEIGSSAFYNTGYYNDESSWVDNVLYIGDYLIKANKSIAGSYEIKKGTKVIANNAFYGCGEMTSVIVPDSLVSMGYKAFHNCYALESVYITDLTAWCNIEREWVDINDGEAPSSTPLCYAEKLYLNGQVLTDVVIPEGTTQIGNYAFYNSGNITSVTIPDSVVSIGHRAFDGCSDLKSVYISDIASWCAIDFKCDYGNGEITNPLYYADSLYVNSEVVKNIVIPEGVESIGDCAFCGYETAESVVLPASLKNVGYGAFAETEIEYVFYAGDSEAKEQIEVGYGNSRLWEPSKDGAIWHYNSTNHNYVEIIVAESTCKAYGLKYSKCSDCGLETTLKAIPVKEHISGNWITDKKATVNKAGSKHKECTVCGETVETGKIAQLKCSKPSLKKIENTADGVKITWGKVTGADSYAVYRKTGSGKYTKIATVKGNSKVTYTDKKAKSGKKYYYQVKAVNEAGESSASKAKSILYLSDTTLSTPKSTKSGITLKWKKVTGAEGYQVWRKTGSGSYKEIATVKGNSKVTYTDKKAQKGKTYTYKIKAYKGNTTSAYSNTKKIKDKF